MNNFKIIYLYRHGETNLNVSGITMGQLSSVYTEFTELGYEQIENINKKIIDNNIEVIYASDFERTFKTAQIIAPNSKIIYDARLLERGWGNSNQDGLESDEEARKRINLFLNEYINNYPDKSILFVTHGALMKLIQDVIENVKLDRDNIDNCEIIQYEPSKKKTLIKNKIK